MFKKARYVYTVYKEGSFTKAAEQLYISQPCLSAAIKKLESELGTPLFDRGSPSVRPTELGLEYIRAAEKIIGIEDEFALRLKNAGETVSGEVRIGGSNYVSSYVLPRIIEHFSRDFPAVRVTLTEASSSELARLLSDGQIDLVLDSFDTERPDFSYLALRREHILLAVPNSFESNEKVRGFGFSPEFIYSGEFDKNLPKEIPIRRFEGETFILLKNGNSMYSHAMNAFKAGGFIPKVSLFLDQLSTSYFLTGEGSGISFVTDTVFRYHKFDDPVTLYAVRETETRALGIAERKNARPSAATKKFIEVLKENLK